MNPPTEQLIRDYLNRLSVAARGKLGFSERQSLLDRTRARIEAECDGNQWRERHTGQEGTSWTR